MIKLLQLTQTPQYKVNQGLSYPMIHVYNVLLTVFNAAPWKDVVNVKKDFIKVKIFYLIFKVI